MKYKISHFLIKLLILAVCLAGIAHAAKDKAATEKSLSQIATEIQKLNEQDMKLEGEVGALSRKLRDNSRTLNAIGKKARRFEEQVESQEAALEALQLRKDKALKARAEAQQALQKNLISQQKIRRGMKASPLDSSKVGEAIRLQYWLDYLNRQHQELIEELRGTAVELSATQASYEEKLAAIRKQRKALEKEQQSLKKERQKQKRLVSDIDRKRKANNSRKKTLQADQARLKKLLERLKFAEQFPEFAQEGKVPFAKLKGKLPWPVKGKRENNKFSSGVTLQVKPGTQVRAISHGRVLFADWMKGFGMLVIVDHGDGYLSLYGHNESLYAKAGDWVEPGTVVSVSGQSSVGGLPGVYFEIRRKARALNPAQWCRNR